VSDTTGDPQDSYISLFEAARLLRVRLERITWFIATGQISSIKNPRNKSDRLVSLRDVYGLRNSPHLLARRIIYALIHSYLSQIYASSGENLRFQRASETAQTLAISLPAYENDEEAVFYNMSGILAERSYGYLEIGKPEMTLAMKDEIMRQIRLDHNTRLETWIFLDWARAYLRLHEG
jgi:hypothetical protein